MVDSLVVDSLERDHLAGSLWLDASGVPDMQLPGGKSVARRSRAAEAVEAED